ncbi:hypothetical protein Terro_2563 [Terriglobus roseus DSM 18391]|nr:hypothetical protein [Terriglobus roseus]AFL88806.1 hypothetical protein Terro_2563 [Terriglobus roseus DSM 18391]
MLTLVRGCLAVLTGCLVMVTTDMDRSILLVSVGVAIAVTALALYGIVDSILLLASGFDYPHRWPKRVMQIQGVVGIVIGGLLLTLFFDHAGVEWFLPMAALQALSAAVGEFVLLKHTRAQRWAVWDFAGAFVATCFAVVYATIRIRAGAGFSPAELATAIYLYLLCFGAAQAATAVRMLRSKVLPLDGHSTTRGMELASAPKVP